MPSYPGGVGLMIGIPVDGKPDNRPGIEWAFALMNLHPPMNFDVRWAIVKGKPVAEAREQIAESAVKEGCKYLFFLGTDNTVEPYTLKQLVFDLEHHPKYAISGAIYCHKAPPQEPMVFRGNGIGPYWDWHVGEVFDVSGIGMDATLIRVDALKGMKKPWFKTVDTTDKWLDGIAHSEYWTEDLFFCKRLEETCSVCQTMKSEHEKLDHEFEGWGIMANGAQLATHWDNRSGTPYKLPLNSKPFRKIYKKGPKKVVDLGCGPIEDSYQTNEGETLRVDIRDDVHPDYRCDIRANLPFATGYFDVVFSSHTLEHLSRNEVGPALDEWTRIMKEDGGELRLLLPNLEWAAKHIMNGEIDSDVLNVLFGAQTYKENFHKMGFTQKMLEELLTRKGFTKFDWQYDNYHMMCRAWKKPPAEIQMFNPTASVKIAKIANVDGKEVLQEESEILIQPTSASDLASFVGQQNDGSISISKMDSIPEDDVVKGVDPAYNVVDMATKEVVEQK